MAIFPQRRWRVGLTLVKTPSFESSLPQTKFLSKQPLLHEKLKASSFRIASLKIGDWRRVSVHDGHLVAKLYYAKQQIIWEILEGPLKRKMQIQWNDITSIHAVVHPNQPGILKIELDKPPLFFNETNPQARKHTIWLPGDDFTGGNATTWRTHSVCFPPGVLEIHYEKLLQCHMKLVDLSRKPFPSHDSPIFRSEDLQCVAISRSHFNRNEFQQQAHYTYPAPHPQAHYTYPAPPSGGPPHICPNLAATANLQCTNTGARNHELDDEIAPLTEEQLEIMSAFLNPNSNDNPDRNIINQSQMIDYCTDGFDSLVPQSSNRLSRSDDIATALAKLDSFVKFMSGSSDNHAYADGAPFQNQQHPLPDNDLTRIVNYHLYQNQRVFSDSAALVPDSRFLPGNNNSNQTAYGASFQNQHPMLDNDLATPLINHHLYGNQHVISDNPMAHVNHQHVISDNPMAHENHQHVFSDNPMAHVNHQHVISDNPMAHENHQHVFSDNPMAHENHQHVFSDNPMAHVNHQHVISDNPMAHENHQHVFSDNPMAHENHQHVFSDNPMAHVNHQHVISDNPMAHENHQHVFSDNLMAHVNHQDVVLDNDLTAAVDRLLYDDDGNLFPYYLDFSPGNL
ncbi:hypothetical protein ABFS83_14G126900 [Erythranthe nasuta]